MSSRFAACPSCGARIEFQSAGTLIVVCAHCQTASWRRELDLERIGKVAELAPIDSPIALGVRGRFDGRAFAVVGVVQLERDASLGGGLWNEWAVAFDDGSHAWLAEAQGEVLVTSAVEPLPASLPNWSDARVDVALELAPHGRFAIVERGSASVRTLRGELPEPIAPGSQRRYADLTGERGGFGTLDYEAGESCAALYLGRRVALAELALDTSGAEVRPERVERAAKIDCGKCGGSIALSDPDGVERLGCPYCDALLDPSSEKARVVGIARSVKSTPKIPLGAKGSLRGGEHEVIAYLVRSTTYEGVRYPWDEYLLRRSDGAYRWLVCSSGHWSFVESVNAAGVVLSGSKARWNDITFRRFATAKARVDLVLGEVYWKVECGETVQAVDYVAPPRMLSVESSDSEKTISVGTYMTPDEVSAAFRLPASLPRPSGVGAQQPNPHAQKRRALWAACGVLAVGVLALMLLFTAVRHERQVWSTRWSLAPAPTSEAQSLASDEFELADRPTRLVVRASGIPEGRLTFDGVLIATDGATHSFDLRATGTSEAALPDSRGEHEFSWPGLERGRYRLRLEAHEVRTSAGPARTLDVAIHQGRAHPGWGLIAILLLTLPPLLVTFATWAFENARWQESDAA